MPQVNEVSWVLLYFYSFFCIMFFMILVSSLYLPNCKFLSLKVSPTLFSSVI